MDDQIGRLVQAVGARGEDVNWIVVGDHGEALGYEHGEHNHGLFLYQETMHVPLVVRPAQPLARPAVISKPAVSTADVLPTALGLLGVPTPDGLDGRDLGPLLRGEPMDHPGAYMESHTALKRFGYHPEVAWTDGVHKLMDTPTPHLYDLSSDPGETINLLPKEASTAASLRVPLQAVLDSKVDSEVLAPDPGVAQQLEALGYLDGGFTLDPDQDPTVDAKDRVELITELERLRILALDVKKMPEVVSAYQAVLVKEPRMVEGHMGLARAYQRMGKPRLARQALEAALVLQPESTILKANLANSLAAEGRHTDGLALMESILAVVPRDDIAQVGVLRMLSDLDRREEALARADAWLAEDPDNPAIEAHRGVLLARLSRYSEAEAILEASLRDGVPRQFVHRFLAIIALDRSEPAVAARHLKRELDAFPGSRDERIMLADVLTRLGAWDEAAAEYAFLAETEPGDHHWAHNHAQCVFNTADYERAGEILAPLLEVSEPLPEVLLLRANILGKQGLMEEGQAMFERANEAKQAERAGGPPE